MVEKNSSRFLLQEPIKRFVEKRTSKFKLLDKQTLQELEEEPSGRESS